MAAITDGTFTSPLQDGDKQVVFPFDFLGDAYARMITRPYVMLSSSYSAPRTLTTSSYTNYALRSEAFSNASWTATAVTPTDGNANNPMNGGPTASTILETAANTGHNVSQNYTYTATTHTLSVYAKPNGRDWIELSQFDGTTRVRSYFNITTGTAGTTSANTTSGLESAGNGWYRVYQIWTAPLAASGTIAFELSTDGSTLSYAGDITKGCYLWGAQLERASSAGFYLPTTSATRTSSIRTRDSQDNTTDSGADQWAFLCQETPPDAGSLRQGIARFSRTYMRLPGQKTDYGSAIITRPVLDDIKSGTTYAVSWDDRFSWVFSSRKSITSFAAPDVPNTANINNGSTLGSLAGSATISVTADNSTQTFADNASDSTIQDAMSNAVLGNTSQAASFKILRNLNSVTVFASSTATTISALSSNSIRTEVVAAATLGQAVTAAELFTFTATDVNAASIRSVSATGHGGVAGDRVAFWNGDKIVAKGVVITAATDSFTANLDAIPGKDFTATHCAFSTDASACYVNGPVSVSTKIVTDFYYPGWSPGVTTPADISVVSTQLDPISWLGLIVAGTAYGAIETGNVEKYQGGPFYSYTATYAQMSDALDTVTP